LRKDIKKAIFDQVAGLTAREAINEWFGGSATNLKLTAMVAIALVSTKAVATAPRLWKYRQQFLSKVERLQDRTHRLAFPLGLEP